jgi:hypothetical protein
VTKKRLDFLDIVYLALMILPIVAGIVLKVLTKPLSEGISVTGAQIYFTVPMPIQDLPITEAQINSWLVILVVLGLCLFLTRKLKTRDIGVRQIVAEWLVEKADGLIADGFIGGGMLPKLKNCIDAVKEGVTSVHILDGRMLHSLLLEFFTDKGIGTAIYK